MALALALLASGRVAAQAPGPAPIAEGLRAPDDGRYEGPIDWSTVPPWRQSSFFGVRAQGRVFIYVVDCSGSMGDAARLARAKSELRRSVGALQWPQRYHVIFYNDRPIDLPGGPLAADAGSKRKLTSWLGRIAADGETDPREAMRQALALRPDAVFLLSDGAFPEGTASAITKANPRRLPIHCIDLSGGAGGPQLRAIARESGGQYASRP